MAETEPFHLQEIAENALFITSDFTWAIPPGLVAEILSVATAHRTLETLRMPGKKLDFDTVRTIALALPEVEESTIRGAPSLKVSGRLLACPALHKSAEPDSLVVHIDLAQRTGLLASAPDIYYLTPHYQNYPMILVRLNRITQSALKKLLTQAWRSATSSTKSPPRK